MFDDRDADHEASRLIATMRRRRAQWEPLYEVTQMKGDGEAHPALVAERRVRQLRELGQGKLRSGVPTTPDMLPREYAREALKRGLELRGQARRQPVQVRHGRGRPMPTPRSPPREEDNFFGKVVIARALRDPIRFEEVIAGRPAPKGHQLYARQTSASGLAGCLGHATIRARPCGTRWRARRCYATTGTRLRVRVFGGWDFEPKVISIAPISPKHGYAKGVPMGGDLMAAPAGKVADVPHRARCAMSMAPTSIASRSSRAGSMRTARRRRKSTTWPGLDGRKPGADGKLPPVGNTVDVEKASYTNAIGRAVSISRIGRTRTSIRRCVPSTTSACSKSRRRAGRPIDHKRLRRRSCPTMCRLIDPGARLHLAHLVHAIGPDITSKGRPRWEGRTVLKKLLSESRWFTSSRSRSLIFIAYGALNREDGREARPDRRHASEDRANCRDLSPKPGNGRRRFPNSKASSTTT